MTCMNNSKSTGILRSRWWHSVKGTVPRDFRLFSWVSFPQALSKFLKISRRYSPLKVHHNCRCSPAKNGKKLQSEKFHYFFTSLGSRVNIKKKNCQVHFKGSAVWYCSHYLPQVLLIPAVHLPHVRISPRIFKEIQNDPNVIFRGFRGLV